GPEPGPRWQQELSLGRSRPEIEGEQLRSAERRGTSVPGEVGEPTTTPRVEDQRLAKAMHKKLKIILKGRIQHYAAALKGTSSPRLSKNNSCRKILSGEHESVNIKKKAVIRLFVLKNTELRAEHRKYNE
ncbi:unnamed protein product, partial [Amoebophrya sp. A25]